MRPKRTDDKYWTGTRNFNHIQYESDLEDYIIDLENETQQLRKHAVSRCFYLQSEKMPDNSGEYEVITNRGRVIKIKYKLFEDNGIWECEYGEHEINESVVAWRFLK